jgi:hypothetical protein
MQRARIRSYVLVVVVVLAAASMFPSFGGSSGQRDAPKPHKRVALVAESHHSVRASVGPTR